MDNGKIRAASLADISALLAIESACFESDCLSKRNFHYFITKAQALLYVIEEDQKVVGYCLIIFRRNSLFARLYSIAILPQNLGNGFAEFLLKFAEKKVKEKGLHGVILEVRQDNARAQRFYQRLGYVEFGRYPGYYEDGMLAIRMKKDWHDDGSYHC